MNNIIKNAEKRMGQCVTALTSNLTKIRTGRPSPSVLDSVQVEYYGSMVPLSQVANVTLLDARTIGVTPWEKNMITKVEKAIRDSNLGFNPATMGDVVRVPMPLMSEERRRELVKIAKQEGEQSRVAVRIVRRDANNDVKQLAKDKVITEGEHKSAETRIHQLTDKHIDQIDQLVSEKEQAILEV